MAMLNIAGKLDSKGTSGLLVHRESTRLPMGAKCGEVTCCSLWVQRSNPGCCSLFEQSSGVGSREAHLSPINGWQVRDQRLTA